MSLSRRLSAAVGPVTEHVIRRWRCCCRNGRHSGLIVVERYLLLPASFAVTPLYRRNSTCHPASVDRPPEGSSGGCQWLPPPCCKGQAIHQNPLSDSFHIFPRTCSNSIHPRNLELYPGFLYPIDSSTTAHYTCSPNIATCDLIVAASLIQSSPYLGIRAGPRSSSQRLHHVFRRSFR